MLNLVALVVAMQTSPPVTAWSGVITYQVGTVVLEQATYPTDIVAAYRKLGAWDFPFPLKSNYSKFRLMVTNCDHVADRVDSAGNRWCRIFPRKLDDPVRITVLQATEPATVNIGATDSLAYTVPEEYKGYLGKTANIDPTLAGAAGLAKTLRGKTRSETIRNVWEWTNRIKYAQPGIERSGTRVSSEDAIKTGQGVCLDQAESTVAVFRALGFASRPVRGVGHSWCEIWLPKIGWHIIQQHVELERAGWLTGFLAEPLDDSTYSPVLPWNFCSDFYAWQFQEFFVRYRGTKDPKVEYSAPMTILGTSTELYSLDDVAKSLEGKYGKIIKTKFWKD